MFQNIQSHGVAVSLIFRIAVVAALIVLSSANTSPAAIFPASPFAGVLQEGWESFHKGSVSSPLTIMSGHATFFGTGLEVYKPNDVGFGLGTSGDAQVAEGAQGLGSLPPPSRIKFNVPVHAFGGYFGAATAPECDPSRITFEFFGSANQSLGATWLDYSRSAQLDGRLLWSGATSTEPIHSVVIRGYYVVNDSLQANPVPEPSTLALLGMGVVGGLAGAWRRAKINRILVCLLALFVSIAAVARADSFATTINSFGSPAGGLDSVYGWSFIPTTNISVTQLGVFDCNSYYHGPSMGLYDSHPIGIWNSSDPSTLLVSTTVPAGASATLIDYIRYQPVTPTLLMAGTEYVIGAYYPKHTPPFYGDFQLVAPYNGVDISTDPHLVFVNRRASNDTSGLKFPSVTSGGVELGPTFQFTIIPEPSTLALMLTATLGVLFFGCRRR